MPKEAVPNHALTFSKTEVNIIFHGTFGFLLQPNTLLVSTPKVPEHTYAIRVSGPGVPNYATPLMLVPYQATTVGLCPNNKACDPYHLPNPTKSLYLAKPTDPSKIHLDLAYYTLRLPLPSSFTPLRCMRFTDPGVWKGGDTKYMSGQKTPATAMLLRYDKFVLSDFSLMLRDADEHRGIDAIPPIDQSGNIHFFADPINEMPAMERMPSHPTQAFASLTQLYSLDLTFTPPPVAGGNSTPEPDPPAPIPPLVTKEDEFLLSELIGPPPVDRLLSLYGRNCTGVILNPKP
jgi:hypothetical protein